MTLPNNARIAIFESHRPATDKPILHVKNKHAKEMILRGKAVRCDERNIKLLAPNAREIAISCRYVDARWNQGAVYESAAIDTSPVVFQGGLNRTETQPAKFQIAKGARVGHQ